jgi:hypothetical protein
MEYISTKIKEIEYLSGFPPVIEIINTLGVFNYIDDLNGKCTVNWFLSDEKKNIVCGEYTLTQEQYDEWDSSPLGLLQIIAKYLNIIII